MEMKTKFAKEKSEYTWLMWKNIEDFELSIYDRRKNYTRMQELEKEIQMQGDKIITIVTTENTSTPLMSMENIKNG